MFRCLYFRGVRYVRCLYYSDDKEDVPELVSSSGSEDGDDSDTEDTDSESDTESETEPEKPATEPEKPKQPLTVSLNTEGSKVIECKGE